MTDKEKDIVELVFGERKVDEDFYRELDEEDKELIAIILRDWDYVTQKFND
jgi:hypothetical protein